MGGERLGAVNRGSRFKALACKGNKEMEQYQEKWGQEKIV